MSLSLKSRRRWWVEAAGKVWGPYNETRLVAFADEGRIGAQTLVAPSAQGPFMPVRQHAELAGLFVEEPEASPRHASRAPIQPIPLQPIPLQSHPRPAPVVQPAEPASAPARPPSPAARVGARPLLVWASLNPSGVEAFEQLLATHGAMVRLGAGLWLVRSQITAAGLRNALTRRLRGAEALLVCEASLQDVAWFNLDGAADRAARGLWQDG